MSISDIVFQTSCTFDYLTQSVNNYTYVAMIYLMAFIIPVSVIVCSYIGIGRAVKVSLI